MLIKVINNMHESYTIGQLRRDNPNVSFPKDIPNEILVEYGVYSVNQVTASQIDNKTHRHTYTIQFLHGEWTQVWQEEQLPQDQAEANIRAHRGYLLQESDWIISKSYERGEPVPTAWSAYRQALRDITAQDGFPFSVVWPPHPVE